MINLLESIDFYLQKGYEDAYATAKVAQDIILSKIAKLFKKRVKKLNSRAF